jgi:hypothetical protein
MTPSASRQRVLSPLQRHAARLLAAGYGQAHVGRLIERSPRTIREWLKREDFRALVDEQRQGEHSATVLERLRELLFDEDPRVSLAAARELNKMTASDSARQAAEQPAVYIVADERSKFDVGDSEEDDYCETVSTPEPLSP